MNTTGTRTRPKSTPRLTPLWTKCVRLVLDTNIIVSGFISPLRPPAQLLAAVRREQAVLLTSQAQIRELADVISRPHVRKYLVAGAAERFQETVNSLAVIVPDPLPDVTASSDPDDNLILATALAGRAELIVTGDKKHLLSLGTFQGIRIMTAAATAAMLRERTPKA